MKPENVLERVKKTLQKRTMIVERMPSVLHTIHVPAIMLVEDLKPLDLDWQLVYLAFKNDHMTLLYPEDRMVQLGKRFLQKELKKIGSYQEFINGWKSDEKRYHAFLDSLRDTNFKRLSFAELGSLYKTFIRVLRNVWMVPITSTNISYYADNVWIPKITKKYGKEGLEKFTVLSTPSQLSEIAQEEIDLLKIAVRIQEDKKLSKKISGKTNLKTVFALIKSDYPLVYRLLDQHTKKFYWVMNNYKICQKLDMMHFLEIIRGVKDSQKTLQKLEEERKASKEKFTQVKGNNPFSKEEWVVSQLIATATTLQDWRKRNNLMGNYWVYVFLREIAKRTNYSFKELTFTNIKEVEEILEGKKISRKILQSRFPFCVEILGRKIDEIVGGKIGKELYAIVNGYDKVRKKVTEIKGISASLGKAEGIVRVVPDVSKVKVFNEGDILVASMTRPEYTPLMKKAGAIVTNEGGITCHAAIVSRELGIPCIISTKIATQALKDGMKVEVNADKGIVKVFKK